MMIILSFETVCGQVTKFSDILNLAILYLMKLVHTKFSDFINSSIDVINQPCILQVQHVLNIVKKNENAKIAKFSIPLNLANK